jgi:NADH-quinone oxidoreductase subunit A
MLRDYLPALVFVGLGAVVGLVFVSLNRWFGVRSRPRNRAVREPYECGLPSEFRRGMRFGISFYLVAMLFIIFDLEVLLLFPTALVLRDLGLHALIAIGIFIGLLGVAFVYEWRRGAMDWK